MEYSDRAFTTLRGELTQPQYAELTDQAAADALNATAEVPNPTPRPTVPLRFTWETFINLLSAAEVLGMYNYGNFAADMRSALERNARPELLALWRAAKSVMAAATVTKVETEFAKTQADPDWQPTVTLPSRAEALGLGTVTNMDVYRARLGKW